MGDIRPKQVVSETTEAQIAVLKQLSFFNAALKPARQIR